MLDPFCGSSTTGVAAVLLNRKYVGIDLEDDYLMTLKKRLEEAIMNKTATMPALKRSQADEIFINIQKENRM